MEKHKSGFVTIVGNPNVGKSTLMNAWVGERLSIITSKAQTTRHRILRNNKRRRLPNGTCQTLLGSLSQTMRCSLP